MIGIALKLSTKLPANSPIEWGQCSLAVVSLRSPIDGRRFGLMGRTLMFGEISDVLRYNVSTHYR